MLHNTTRHADAIATRLYHFLIESFTLVHNLTRDVETGREELKKEREIMQLVAGLQLGPDEMERREMPPHMIRSRHGPRYDNTTPWERRRATVKQHVSTGNDNHFTSIHPSVAHCWAPPKIATPAMMSRYTDLL
ncbi:hypothetical protein RR46_10207 [Papilio xuthus]|uniref:Uncharacterized protein n=1 Tax=Papilio xuthus TaxID=66420 RepID=A0A194Q1L9_PAPXU|nr:hypothetical protein RR46_10207 [Papilio xuthus]